MTIAELCTTLERGDRKRMTTALKNLERRRGRYAEHFSPEEAEIVFRFCRNLIERAGTPALHIESALRLLRFTVLTFPFLAERTGDLFGILRKTILHAHGNVSRAAMHLADRMSFAFSCLLELPSDHPMALSHDALEGMKGIIVEGYRALLVMDEEYCRANPKLRASASREKKIGYYQAARSPSLRALRGTILCLHNLRVEEMAEGFGVTLPITFSDADEEEDMRNLHVIQRGNP